jgi:thiaminase
MYLGAGAYQTTGNSRAGITAELKADLLQNKNSPYKEWAQVYSIGFVYGF